MDTTEVDNSDETRLMNELDEGYLAQNATNTSVVENDYIRNNATNRNSTTEAHIGGGEMLPAEQSLTKGSLETWHYVLIVLGSLTFVVILVIAIIWNCKKDSKSRIIPATVQDTGSGAKPALAQQRSRAEGLAASSTASTKPPQPIKIDANGVQRMEMELQQQQERQQDEAEAAASAAAKTDAEAAKLSGGGGGQATEDTPIEDLEAPDGALATSTPATGGVGATDQEGASSTGGAVIQPRRLPPLGNAGPQLSSGSKSDDPLMDL